jgi:hypothetical protein
VIQGLRVLPWTQDARREGTDVPTCSECLETVSEPMRRAMGCGWLTRELDAGGKSVTPPESVPFGDRVEGLEYCSGFACELPDVIDVSEVYLDWERGGHDREPAESLRLGVKVLHGAIAQMTAGKQQDAIKRGGR